MTDSTFISLENLELFKTLFLQFVTTELNGKLNADAISNWALEKSKPDYDASEIFMIGNPAQLNTKSKYLVDSINEIYDASAYYFDVDEDGVLQPAIGKTIDIDAEGVISII